MIFTKIMEKFIEHLFDKGTFYIVIEAFIHQKQLKLLKLTNYMVKEAGIKIPYLPTKLGKKIFNIQNKLNEFTFFVPIRQDFNSLLSNYFSYTNDIIHNCNKCYPYLIPLATSLRK